MYCKLGKLRCHIFSNFLKSFFKSVTFYTNYFLLSYVFAKPLVFYLYNCVFITGKPKVYPYMFPTIFSYSLYRVVVFVIP